MQIGVIKNAVNSKRGRKKKNEELENKTSKKKTDCGIRKHYCK